MPRYWHDKHSVNKIEDIELREINRALSADKKPYFMKYIYPALMRQYNTYIKNTNRNSLREFQFTVSELMRMPYEDLTERQCDFLRYYNYRMPVGLGDCVMNKICRAFEQTFDRHAGRVSNCGNFDYTILKSGTEYTAKQFGTVKRLYEDYNKRLKNYAIFADYERVDDCDSREALSTMNEEFRKECDKVCPDKRALCDIILDICYSKKSTKRFAWNICGDEIIHNLLEKNNFEISYPTISSDGEIQYCGERFTIKKSKIEDNE